MKRSALSLAALCLMAAAPALAQQASQQAPTRRPPVTDSQLAGQRSTLATAQQRLQQLGYHTKPTGHYDAATRNAVTAFQADHGIEPSGDVTLTTLAALGIAIQPTGATAMMPPEPGQQTAMVPESAEQLAAIRYETAPVYNFPLLRDDEHMDAPQVRNQSSEIAPLGVPEQLSVTADGRIPGVEPSFPTEDILR